jgi:1-acyl-sn-glycerol-3-phosphate acyltransferase
MLREIGLSLGVIWRAFGIGLLFVLFSLGSLLLGYVIVPLIHLLSRRKGSLKYQAQYSIHLMFRLIIFAMQALGLIKIIFKDFDKLTLDRSCLIIANHPTLIDYVAIISKLPRCDNIVKEALWHNPFLKRIVTLAGYIPNLDATTTFLAVQNALSQNTPLLIFPEGTRSTPGQPITIKRGAAQIAVRIGVPMHLIHIHCIPPILTKNKKWYKLPKEVPHLILSVGKCWLPPYVDIETVPPSLAARKLTREIQHEFLGDKPI